MRDALGGSLDENVLIRVLEATGDAIVFIDARSRIVHFNPAASRIFGYTRDEVLAQPVGVLMPEPLASEHVSYIERYERYEQTSEERGAIREIRKVMGRRRNGELFPVELSIAEVEHERVRYAAILRDISERARVVGELSQTNRLAAIGLRASIFAHEVGNPLNNMYIQAQLLERKIAKLGLAEDLGTAPSLFLHELRRLVELLQEFRALHGSGLRMSMVSVVVILQEVLGTLFAGASAAEIELREDIQPGLPPVMGNANKLKQVFINLCKNAIEAMPKGGLLSVRATASDGGLRVEIEDTGDGIPGAFDPFEAFNTTKLDGSGLGLPVVRQIVRQHSGEVSFSTDPGRGTVFTVNIPVAGAAPSRRSRESPDRP